MWQKCACVCVYSSLNGEGKTSRVTELMQIELAFISPCSILCGRYLHFPKASSSLPVPPANPEPWSRGKPYKIWGISLHMERGEPKSLGRGALSPGQQGWADRGWRWGQQGALHTPAHIWGAFGCRVVWHHPDPMCWSPSWPPPDTPGAGVRKALQICREASIQLGRATSEAGFCEHSSSSY